MPTCDSGALAKMIRIVIPSGVEALDIRANNEETHGYQGQFCETMSPLTAFTHVYSLFFKIIRKNVDFSFLPGCCSDDATMIWTKMGLGE